MLELAWAEEPELRPPFTTMVEGVEDALRKVRHSPGAAFRQEFPVKVPACQSFC